MELYDIRAVSNLIWVFGRFGPELLKFKTETVSATDVCNLLFWRVTKAAYLNSLDISNIVLAIVNLEISLDETKLLLTHLNSIAIGVSERLDPQCLSNIIWAFGNI